MLGSLLGCVSLPYFSAQARTPVPAISVLMPVYNAEAYVEAAIRSILEQTFADFELIVVNDGSRDGSGEIIARMARAEARIVPLEQENAGIVASLNRAAGMASGELLARMDADDLALPRRFERQHAAFQARPDLAALGGHAWVIDQAGRIVGASYVPVGRREILRDIESSSPLIHPAAMIRRVVFEQLGGYRSRYETTEDYDLWLRMLDAGYVIDNLNEMVLHYRQHPGGVSSSGRARQALAASLARSASRMRRQGHSDQMAQDCPVDAAAIRGLPRSFRPCEAELLEAVHGPLGELDAEGLQEILRGLRLREPATSCRRQSASLQLRCGVMLLARGRIKTGLAAIGTALRADPLVMLRQLLRSTSNRLIRARRRIAFRAHGQGGALG
jgi:GT2 family glycosyltransferase